MDGRVRDRRPLLRHAGTDGRSRPARFVIDPASYVEYEAKVNTTSTAGLIFAYTSSLNFLYAAVVAGTNQVILGHRNASGWFTDAVATRTVMPGIDNTLLVSLEGSNVNVVLNNVTALSYTYNFQLTEGDLGLLGPGRLGELRQRRDPWQRPGLCRRRSAAVGGGPSPGSRYTDSSAHSRAALRGCRRSHPDLDVRAGSRGDEAVLRQTAYAVADLPDSMMGQTIGRTVAIDSTAAGFGWFIDPTPWQNEEFAKSATGDLVAFSGSLAEGKVDLMTVVMHEFGNVLGRPLGGDGLMARTLPVGTRRGVEPAINSTVRDVSVALPTDRSLPSWLLASPTGAWGDVIGVGTYGSRSPAEHQRRPCRKPYRPSGLSMKSRRTERWRPCSPWTRRPGRRRGRACRAFRLGGEWKSNSPVDLQSTFISRHRAVLRPGRLCLSGFAATPLERLLADRIALCWLSLHDAEDGRDLMSLN